MDGVIFNATLRIDRPDIAGFHRVLVATPAADHVLLYRIATLNEDPANTFRAVAGKDQTSDKNPTRPWSKQLWISWEELALLRKDSLLRPVKIKTFAAGVRGTRPLTVRHERFFENRKKAMHLLLDAQRIEAAFLQPAGFAKLVRQIVQEHRVRKSSVHEWWHLLCTLGFHPDSLRPQIALCGAPGVPRPWGKEAGRLKPGRWTNKERNEVPAGQPRHQPPGWSQVDEKRLVHVYRHRKDPKKTLKDLYPDLIKEVFSIDYIDVDGTPEPQMPAEGSYPDRRTATRIINKAEGKLQTLKNKTTNGHFNLNHRGLVGRSYKGAAGPGHRYAIDATRGDIYLRSSINRAWIIGRPIVYLIVDAWSTAVVGFYCCLEGPSWATAQVALYSTTCGSSALGEIWGIQYDPMLNPFPTICAELVVDRGELLCDRARDAASTIGWIHTVLPSYRADLKGWVEVLHRIAKNRIYAFAPGAINARRKEYELRATNAKASTLTLRSYAALLAMEIERYNVTADRRHRVTQEMAALGVVATPAGLWKFGHEVGLGFQKFVDHNMLIRELLPRVDLRVTRQGIYLGDLLYSGDRQLVSRWTETARNFAAYTLPGHYHPGSVAKVWTPNANDGEMIQLQLSTEAVAKSQTAFEEYADFRVIKSFDNAKAEREALRFTLSHEEKKRRLLDDESKLTVMADEGYTGPLPSVSEARDMEKQNRAMVRAQGREAVPSEVDVAYSAPGMSHYERLIQEVLASNLQESSHA